MGLGLSAISIPRPYAFFHDIGQKVDLVLQQQHVSPIAGRQHLVGKRLRDLQVRAAIKQDTVLPLLVHLDDRVPAGLIELTDETGIGTARGEKVEQHAAVPPDTAGVEDRRTRPGERDRLVEAFAAAEAYQPVGREGLPPPAQNDPPRTPYRYSAIRNSALSSVKLSFYSNNMPA